ncbi:YfaZ family outer membrane protein [Thiomicrospira cyclica]|uniref:YfaZ family protein n=1 Tax=Thiomicrospira cyclica (strain DSM 14477 / JCM 11371 / ALM1) TaxID=717773 RepID=F6D908_THICA|nr:YfaZ family outer membrane protein [Thiomicrospira cyclica]AEG30839.1 YfaZ family protein [Thiomicrospira cyclica ALM1]
MKKTLQALAATALISASLPMVVHANEMGINVQLANDSAKFGFFSSDLWMQETYRFDLSYQYNNDKDYVIDTSFSYVGKGVLDPNLDLGVKGKFAYAKAKDIDKLGTGILLGVHAAYWLPTATPTNVTVEYLIAPEILAFSDAEKLNELSIRANVRLLRNLQGFVGYRHFEVEYKEAKVKFDDGAHIGFELAF